MTLLLVVAGTAFEFIRGAAAPDLPLSISVLAGFVLVIVAMAGLVLIYNALGLSDGGSALGLPSGSVRALLALALVTVFIGVCSAELIEPASVVDPDVAKQILSISATALTTIIGFYFGTNAASDAFSAANQTANSATSGTPPTLDDLTHQAASIRSVAEGMQQKLVAAKDPEPDQIAKQNPEASALSGLRDKLAAATAQVTATGVDRDRAAKLVADATADASKLAASATTMQQYSADAAKAQTSFGPELIAFTDARDALLATLAKG
jgi:hypothetical protein